jgi:hypothetical protein
MAKRKLILESTEPQKKKADVGDLGIDAPPYERSPYTSQQLVNVLQEITKMKLTYPADILNLLEIGRETATDELLGVPTEYYHEQEPSAQNIGWMRMRVRESYNIWPMAAGKTQLFVHSTYLTPVRHIAEYLKNSHEFAQIDKCQELELLQRTTRTNKRPAATSTSCMTVRSTGGRAVTTGFDVNSLFASFRDACGDSSGQEQQSRVNSYISRRVGRQIQYLLAKNSRKPIPDLPTLLQIQRHFGIPEDMHTKAYASMTCHLDEDSSLHGIIQQLILKGEEEMMEQGGHHWGRK